MAADIELSGWLERMRAGEAGARNEFFQRCQERLRRLTLRMFQDYRRLGRLEEPSDVLQNASVRLLRRLEKAPPGSLDEFFQLAAREIRCELIDLSRHHFGPQGAAARQFAGGGNLRIPEASRPRWSGRARQATIHAISPFGPSCTS